MTSLKEGDEVYHKTNNMVKMLVTETRTDYSSRRNYVTCRWVDVSENVHTFEFLEFELIKKK